MQASEFSDDFQIRRHPVGNEHSDAMWQNAGPVRAAHRHHGRAGLCVSPANESAVFPAAPVVDLKLCPIVAFVQQHQRGLRHIAVPVHAIESRSILGELQI